jgi:hypothetical protein
MGLKWIFTMIWMTALRKYGHPSTIDGLHYLYLLPGPPTFLTQTFVVVSLSKSTDELKCLFAYSGRKSDEGQV